MSRIIVLSQEPATQTQLINVGVTTIAPNNDSGNAGLILAQKVILESAGQLQSLSFYTNNAIGNIKLALYDATGASGGPGNKVAETGSVAAAVGWNTINVISQVALVVATYWMAYEVSNNSLTFRNSSSGNFVLANQTYGTMPAVFPAFGLIQSGSWSFYMTIAIGNGVPAVPVVSPASFLVAANPTLNEFVGNVSATNNPTSFAITAGDTANNFAISSSGVLSTAATGSPPAAGNYSLSVTATNVTGTSIPVTISVTVQAVMTGFPDATNTGVSSGTTLTNSGPINVNTNGAIISGKNITGSLTVDANNVIVENCKINCSGENYGIGLMSGRSGLTVRHCEVFGIPITNNRPASHVLTAIACDFDASMANVEISFCDIHGIENAIGGGNLFIHDNYIHDFAIWQVGGDTDHTDGVQTAGSTNIGGMRIIHNTIIGICTAGGLATPTNYQAGSSCVALSMGMHDLTIDGNFFAGGTYTLYGNAQAGGSPANTHVTNNRFSTQYYPNAEFPGGKCGCFGTSVGFAVGAVGFIWTGNVIHETGAVVSPA